MLLEPAFGVVVFVVDIRMGKLEVFVGGVRGFTKVDRIGSDIKPFKATAVCQIIRERAGVMARPTTQVENALVLKKSSSLDQEFINKAISVLSELFRCDSVRLQKVFGWNEVRFLESHTVR